MQDLTLEMDLFWRPFWRCFSEFWKTVCGIIAFPILNRHSIHLLFLRCWAVFCFSTTQPTDDLSVSQSVRSSATNRVIIAECIKRDILKTPSRLLSLPIGAKAKWRRRSGTRSIDVVVQSWLSHWKIPAVAWRNFFFSERLGWPRDGVTESSVVGSVLPSKIKQTHK